MAGKRVLVVEDQSTLALELCDRLEDAGCSVVGPAARVHRALELVDRPIDVALLDIDLWGEPSFPVARELRQRGVPVLLLTGFDEGSVPEDLDELDVFEKPIEADRLLNALQRLFEHA